MNFAKNLFYLLLSDAFGKLSNFIAIAYLSRVLLPEGVGIFNWIFSIVAVLVLLPGFGLNEYGILAIAGDRSKKNIEDVVGRILGFRFIFGSITYVGLLIFLFASSFSIEYTEFFAIAGLLVFSTIFSFDWFFTSVENQFYIGMARVFSRLSYLFLTVFFVHSKTELILSIWFYVFGELLFSAILMWIYKYRLKFDLKVQFRNFQSLLKSAFPLAVYTSSSLLIYSADVAIIGSITTMYETGLYSSSIRIISLFISLKYLFGQMFYPKIVTSFSQSDTKVSDLIKLITKYSIPSSIVLSAILILFSNTITTLTLGQKFVESTPIFILMIPAVFCEFCWIAFPYLVITKNRVMYSSLIITVSVIKLMLVTLVYKFSGLFGCAVSYSIMNVLLFILCILYVHRKIFAVNFIEWILIPLGILAALIALYFMNSFLGPVIAISSGMVLLGFYLYSISKQLFSYEILKRDYLSINSA